MFEQLGVIGCGLIGGSFALALKRAGMVGRVVGYSKSPSTTEQARRLGVIDVVAESALLAVSGSDIVLVAVPVAAMEATFKAIRHLIDPGTLVMDVGSTKRDVVDAARRVLKDRIGSFVPAYVDHKILKVDPFQTLDASGVGLLVEMGVAKGRKSRQEKHGEHLKVGICGEHGGDPESVAFCHKVGMDYVSCSPFRVPIARLAAAQAALADGKTISRDR